jgi:hypothetical protein
MDPVYAEAVGDVSGILENGGKMMIVANFMINLFLGGALSQLFAAIGKLQIMVHLLITNVAIPANAQVFSSGLLSLVTYELIETEDILRNSLNLVDDQEFNLNFYALGYHSVFFLINIGNLLFVIIFMLAVYLFLFLTRKTDRHRLIQLREWLHGRMNWKFLIEFINETYIILAISCCMQFKFMQYQNFGESLNSVLSTIFWLALMAAPFIGFALLWKNKKRLDDDSFKKRFLSLYEHLNF